MRKPIAVSLLTAFAVVAFSATQLRAQVILPNLPAGTQYQIIFATADSTTATSSNIADYNTFVTNEANANPTLAALGVQWNDVGSTATVNANVNAPWGNDLVFNTRGIQVASPSHGLYSGTLLTGSSVQYNQYGGAVGVVVAYTGSTAAGVAEPTFEFGGSSGKTEFGQTYNYNSVWIEDGVGFSTIARPVYALSTPITAVPEPATFTLFGSALVLLGGVRFLRRSLA